MKLSIIIPTLNEADNITPLLRHLRLMQGINEIIICDGGSEDDTVCRARAVGAVVVTAQRNRGTQLNAGARVATGGVLWFLHADVRPHPESAVYIARRLQQPRVLGGNFRLRFDMDNPTARAFEMIARIQRRLGIYYGDSSVFVRSEVFEALHGYRAWPLFEDYDFARRLERHARQRGCRIEYSKLPIIVSARRFRGHPWRTALLWASLQTLFWLGVPPHRLALLYHRMKPRSTSR